MQNCKTVRKICVKSTLALLNVNFSFVDVQSENKHYHNFASTCFAEGHYKNLNLKIKQNKTEEKPSLDTKTFLPK